MGPVIALPPDLMLNRYVVRHFPFTKLGILGQVGASCPKVNPPPALVITCTGG